MYPISRKRRLRKSAALRDLVQETHLHPHDFIVPLFVVEGKSVKEEIPSMPNIYRMSLDEIQKEVRLLWKVGLKGVLVFAKVENRLKDNAWRNYISFNQFNIDNSTPTLAHIFCNTF